MAPDETTHLLAKPEPAPGSYADVEEGDANAREITQHSRRFSLWQIGALFGILLAYADTSLVWATHETVASHFDNLENSSWMMTSFTVGSCVTLPLYGRLSGTYGRMRPLISAYCIFCAGCMICGLGQAYWQLIVGRIITGCGASGIISLASIIITDIAAPSEVAVLRSYVNVAVTIGLSVGGPLGGFLAESIGWRWSFLGQVPIAACCCLLVVRALRSALPAPEVEGQEGSQNEVEPKTLNFDFPGAITLTLTISSLLIFIDTTNGLTWTHPLVLTTAIVGTLSLVGFLLLEKYPENRDPLIPLWLLKTEVGAFCVAAMLILGGCHSFVSQIAPYFANTQGASDSEAGGYLVPSSVGNAIGALIAGQAIKKFGSYKRLSLLALFFCILISLWILVQWSHPIGTWEALTVFLSGLFPGIILSAQFIGLCTCVPKQHVATAISLYYMSQQIGIAVGISTSSSIFQQQFQATLYKVLIGIPDYKKIIKGIMSDSSVVAHLPAEVRALAVQGYLSSFWVVPGILLLTQVVALIPMVSTTEKRWN
ncbi:major facilitator superfamily domain-containing protein [Tricladium varicosporioides]|nr:major facilitator superfamily domain-containing protein [Hymenoscyphus varicosporioides]